MKKILFFLCFYLAVNSAKDLSGQEFMPNSGTTGICYAGTRVHRIYIPPRLKHAPRNGLKSGGTINVNYTGFTAQAKNAVEFAVAILKDILPSDLQVTVNASWTKISSSGVLGNSAITGFAGGWVIDALNPMVYYPITIAEKIAGKNLNENNEADIELELNNSINWYFGTDGNTPPNRYDLVTVVLHELCHGLGFFDSMGVTGTQGHYGLGNLPVIYDTFVENQAGRKLTDTTLFPQNSTALYLQLTGGQLFFNGPLTFKYLSGDRARLFAPSTWDPGSSISHLDETRTLDVNSLMTPFIDLGEAIHDPGDLTLSILGDMGWINTRILADGKKDTEEHLTSVELSLSIRSDTLYNKSNVGLVYSFDDFKTSSTLTLNQTSDPDKFTCSVGIPSYNTRISYYFFVEDDFQRLYKSPSLAEKAPYRLFVGLDTVKPVLTHTPSEYYFEKIDSIPIMAVATDNLGIDTVYVEFNVNDGPVSSFGLSNKSNDKYSSSLNVKPLGLKGGDTFNYRIFAIDKASGHNTAIMPSSGYQSISIEALLPVEESYSTDFSDAANDFFNSGFSIEKPAGFNSLALHSEHPYQSPDEDNKEFNFSSVLRHPVVYDGTGMTISFRELVLVEPGEPGSKFGFSNFYDYVILEGSRDFGKSWFPVADGYDCRINSGWESSYNSSTDGQNSTFVGNESMMLVHTFYPKLNDRISSGESMLIRFRLFSDPYAHGWGWVIDDLKILRLIDGMKETQDSEEKIYPNPGRGNFSISLGNSMNNGEFSISIYNTAGKCILKNRSSNENVINVNISHYPAGLYFVVIRNSAGIKTLKYSLVR